MDTINTSITTHRPWDISTATYETAKAYAAFLAYRDSPEPRTVPARAHRTWPAKHRWRERAAAWDMERARVREEVLLQAERSRASDSVRAADLMRQVGIDVLSVFAKLAELQRKKAETAETEEAMKDVKTVLSAKDAIAAATEGIKLTQLLEGKPTDISASAVLLKKRVEDLSEDELLTLLSDTRAANKVIAATDATDVIKGNEGSAVPSASDSSPNSPESSGPGG